MKKTKLIPPFIMLLAGAITSIQTYRNHYELKDMLTTVLLVLFMFYIMGLIIKKILDTFTVIKPPMIPTEGEVIEKELEEKMQEQEELE